MCLPFLRIAALLRYHLYEEPLPIVRVPQFEFTKLVCYLDLVSESTDWSVFNSAVALNWQANEASMSVPRMWCDQFLAFANRRSDAGRNFITEQHISWYAPKLLSLPREYEKIFTVRLYIFLCNVYNFAFQCFVSVYLNSIEVHFFLCVSCSTIMVDRVGMVT